MYTHWDLKINARPANYGTRIDHILCSLAMKDWFVDANIQEGLMGSDHCPVYVDLKDTIELDGQTVNLADVVNIKGVFEGGVRRRELTSRDDLALSGRLLPEFHKRQSIKDMFSRSKPLAPSSTLPASSDSPLSQPSSSAPTPPSLDDNPRPTKRQAKNNTISSSQPSLFFTKPRPATSLSSGSLSSASGSSSQPRSQQQKLLKSFFSAPPPASKEPAPSPALSSSTTSLAADDNNDNKPAKTATMAVPIDVPSANDHASVGVGGDDGDASLPDAEEPSPKHDRHAPPPCMYFSY